MQHSTITLPDRERWLWARRGGIGGSDAAAVLGLSPFTTPLQLWADKRGLTEPIDETDAMRLGRLLEPIIAGEYERETDRLLAEPEPFTLHVHPEHDWLRATLDRTIVAATDKTIPAVLEMKTTSAFARDEWDAEPPLHVQIQGQHQLLVTGLAWVSFVVLIGGQRLRWCDMERNEPFLALYLERARDFWRRVELGEAPPVQAEDREVLAALYPKERNEVAVDLPAAAITWDADREVAMKEIAKWKAIKDEAEARIIAAIGDAAYGVLPDGEGRFSWKTVTRAEVTLKEATYRTLRRLKK